MLKDENSVTESAGKGVSDLVFLPTKDIKMCVMLASVLVWLVGVVRILYIGLFGNETFLRGLQKFNLDDDLSIPSWYSAILLFISALLIFLIAKASQRRDERNTFHWVLLGLIFLFLSMDESIAIHEMSLPLASKLGLSGVFTFVWVLAAIPIVVVLGIFYIPFLLRLTRGIAIKMIIAGAIYVFGIVGMGMISGAVFSELGHQKTFMFSILTAVEEGLEILGLTLFIIVLLEYLSKNLSELKYAFR